MLYWESNCLRPFLAVVYMCMFGYLLLLFLNSCSCSVDQSLLWRWRGRSVAFWVGLGRKTPLFCSRSPIIRFFFHFPVPEPHSSLLTIGRVPQLNLLDDHHPRPSLLAGARPYQLHSRNTWGQPLQVCACTGDVMIT